MNKKLTGSLVFVSLLVLGIIGFLLFQGKIIATQTNVVISANLIAKQTQLISQESFHAQLELWEYINDPNQERLNAFNQYNHELLKNVDDLALLVDNDNETTVYKGGKESLVDITNSIHLVESNWSILLARADEYITVAQNISANDKNSLQSPTVVEKVVALRQQTSASEKYFDEMGFDKKISDFIQNQSLFVDQITTQIFQANTIFWIGLLILAVLYLLLLALLAVWLGNVVSKLKKITYEK